MSVGVVEDPNNAKRSRTLEAVFSSSLWNGTQDAATKASVQLRLGGGSPRQGLAAGSSRVHRRPPHRRSPSSGLPVASLTTALCLLGAHAANPHSRMAGAEFPLPTPNQNLVSNGMNVGNAMAYPIGCPIGHAGLCHSADGSGLCSDSTPMYSGRRARYKGQQAAGNASGLGTGYSNENAYGICPWGSGAQVQGVGSNPPQARGTGVWEGHDDDASPMSSSSAYMPYANPTPEEACSSSVVAGSKRSWQHVSQQVQQQQQQQLQMETALKRRVLHAVRSLRHCQREPYIQQQGQGQPARALAPHAAALAAAAGAAAAAARAAAAVAQGSSRFLSGGALQGLDNRQVRGSSSLPGSLGLGCGAGSKSLDAITHLAAATAAGHTTQTRHSMHCFAGQPKVPAAAGASEQQQQQQHLAKLQLHIKLLQAKKQQHQQQQHRQLISASSLGAQLQLHLQPQHLLASSSSCPLPRQAPVPPMYSLLSWAGGVLDCTTHSAYQLATTMWLRINGQMDEMLLLSLGVSVPSSQAGLLVTLWVASKLEGQRRQVVGCSRLAAVLKLLPWAVTSMELHIMQLLDWRPYARGCSSSSSSAALGL